MKRHIASLITGVVAIIPVFSVLQFEALTGLSSAWERAESRRPHAHEAAGGDGDRLAAAPARRP